ncbi:MAG TPA: glycosyltransferase [Burkholderiaceae bacterium]|nr:glycosyltransferase [Burkholderiaceae bacterium]
MARHAFRPRVGRGGAGTSKGHLRCGAADGSSAAQHTEFHPDSEGRCTVNLRGSTRNPSVTARIIDRMHGGHRVALAPTRTRCLTFSGEGAPRVSTDADGSPAKPRLAFVSPVFLLPADTGGRIRSGNILRGLKGGAFDVTLIGPATEAQRRDHAQPLQALCDRFEAWQPAEPRPRWRRALDLADALPVNVVADRTQPGIAAVSRALRQVQFDVAVFDFVHAAVLQPPGLDCATVCFTHNVEAEIFQRHARQARNSLLKWVWSSQHSKMDRYERQVLAQFTSVVAVSERDAAFFSEHYGVAAPRTIPTGVDLDYFAWQLPVDPGPQTPPTVVFIGSMDWAANIDGVRHFIESVWPRVHAALPHARFVVVGRNPPEALVQLGRSHAGVSFTGFVDDVRPYVREAQVAVIPLRVGGGTRIKAFEAMAMGCPVVSTTVGIEGLGVSDGEHFLCHDDPEGQARAILRVLGDAALRRGLAERARACVERHHGYRVAARAFERICLDALASHRATRSRQAA